MNKELEALEVVKQTINDMLDKGMKMDGDIAISLEQYLNIIESALKRLEVIDNSVKFDMEYYEKRNQALEIIVKKANIRLFKMCGRCYFRTTNNIYEISKEKYDLLTEVLL